MRRAGTPGRRKKPKTVKPAMLEANLAFRRRKCGLERLDHIVDERLQRVARTKSAAHQRAKRKAVAPLRHVEHRGLEHRVKRNDARAATFGRTCAIRLPLAAAG